MQSFGEKRETIRMAREIFKFLASLKLAILLLVVIIFASIAGTLCESWISAEVARRYIYANVLFDIWLTILCINLFCVAAIRYPWKPHQTGFVITHAGIIILLIGSMIDRHWGMEAFLQLHRGAPPTDVMELHEQQLVVSVDGVSEQAYTQFNVKALDKQFDVKSPTPDVAIKVTDTQPVHPISYFVPAEKGPAAAHVRLRGPVMGRTDRWVKLGEKADLMMATVAFLPGKPPPPAPAPDAKDDGTGAKPSTAASGSEELRPRQERWYAFAKQPDLMCSVRVGDPTQVAVKLVADAKTEPTLNLKLFGKDFSIPVKANIGKDYPLPELEGWKLYILAYYPTFRMVDKEAVNIGDQPDNPAIKFDLLGPMVKAAVQAPTAGHGAGGDAPGVSMSGGGPANGLTLYLGDDGKIRYLVKSRVKGEFSGEAEPGKYVLLQWGNSGAEFAIDEFYPHSAQKEEWKPPDTDEANNLSPAQMDESFAPGLKCKITAGGQTQELWIGQRNLQSKSDPTMGDGKTIVELPREFVTVGGKKIGLSFSNRFMLLPFKVGLMKFSAPLNEGEDNMSFASFESTLAFDGHLDWISLSPSAKILQQAKNPQTSEVPIPDALLNGETRDLFGAITADDATQLTMEFTTGPSLTVPKSDVQEYVKKTHKIYMNYPTTYPQTWYGPWLGTTYKFSQADHRMPQDPDYSGVQVLRDPGWMPKWVGCLMICFGIFTMFYLKPYFNRRPASGAKAAAPADAKEIAKAEKNRKKSKDGHSEDGVPGLQSR